VFVTHDIEEAILLGDRIALMNEGQIVQLSTPEALIQDQKEAFTKSFIGQDYPLMVLKRYSVRDLRLEPVSNASITHSMDLDTNLKEALAVCIKQSEPVIFKDKQDTYRLAYSDIFTFIRGMHDETHS
jgi:osmoprotectant transport system ATP-binding protein